MGFVYSINNPMASRREHLANLKAARQGASSRSKQWQSERSSELYDEVDEDEYDRIVRSRLDQNDFIEDDDGSGYVDDGREDWASEEDEDKVEKRGLCSFPFLLPSLLRWRKIGSCSFFSPS